jgi:hypothetical protein
MAETIFVDGMRFEIPNEKTPEWIKGKISVKVSSLIPFLQAHQSEKGWVNIDLKKSKGGTFYLALNTYKKGDTSKNASQPKEVDAIEYPADDINVADVQF